MEAGDRIGRVIVTAGHCLPELPPSFTHAEDQRLYPNLISSIGRLDERRVWGDLLFVDPVSDLAVLAAPDYQRLPEESEAFEAFVADLEPFDLSRTDFVTSHDVLQDAFRSGYVEYVPPPPEYDVSVLSLADLEWNQARATFSGQGRIWLKDVRCGILGGMSGSPIVDASGGAIGIVCTGTNTTIDPEFCSEGGPNPRLSENLPMWLLRAIRKREETG